ncbi:helix-turn-helix transcriptional regulator [Komarekiella sp. 'clone 1']|uniref:Helix-turn-helix transcriptional regulator n=1 Tax=Komarekiella delphini-convector SJRDD-AB1 TaxID=2593771 RepID=A0AA40VTG1_9NOST|nr:AraC family transcriptional regulator [Komarekiella delphini-convector]MBD6619067.1 helix-turn-helix transcriptional regulator [Komarekiella delphini-convector SJRDD-AB1]
MTITLTMQEDWELWEEANQNCLQPSEREPFEIIRQMPKQLGQGYIRDIEVHPELWVMIWDCEYHDDMLMKISEWNHPLEFWVFLSGKIIDEYGGQLGEGYTSISGSGVQRQMIVKSPKSRRVGVSIHTLPDVLVTFFPDETGEIPQQLRLLDKGNDWQTLLYPETTMAIQGIAQQIINCPFQGMTKRMYLQAKVLELVALQLAPILSAQNKLQPSPRLKPDTIARIHYAKEILLSRLENPPSLLELSQIVGVSDRTLRRGFKEMFGTTVFGYLSNIRMEQAEQLLREGKLSVAEVANLSGYSQQGHFAAAFKRKFGITPRECLSGKINILAS